MLNKDIKQVVYEYKDFCNGVDAPEAIEYIFDNVKYDYDIDNKNDETDLYKFISSLYDTKLVTEKVEKHNELNPDLWEDEKLKPEVKDKLLEIVERFKENLIEDEVELDVEDIRIIGSNASYNYTSNSDIDLHIYVDLTDFDDYSDLALKLYQAYKSLWNNKYDPMIKGHEVEIYVEDINSDSAKSAGVYSILTDSWLKKPTEQAIPDVDQAEVDSLVKPFIAKFKEANTIDDIDELIDDIYVMRQEGILEGGEYDPRNLAFKEFRNDGYLQKLKDKKVELENREMSLESLNEEDDQSFDSFLRDAEIILVDDARTFDINKWELESDDELEEMLLETNEDDMPKKYIKYKLDNDKINKIIDKLRTDDISIADYWKTKQFLKAHDLAKDDLYDVIRGLQPRDYVTNSTEVNNRDNEACIFIKNSKVKDLGPFRLYIKIDYDSIASTPVIVVSVHE